MKTRSKIVIIDYGAGNVESVVNGLLTIKGDYEIIISNKISDISSADKLILPGVGAFEDCMAGLRSVEGLLSEINKQVLIEKKPLLGICVGMQVLASIGYENGEHQGLGFIEGKVIKIPQSEGLKIPHMGWNEVVIKSFDHPILKDIKDGEHFYFANSYCVKCQDENSAIAQVKYGLEFDVIIAKENILGIQFHPEKSAEAGLRLLRNFLNWNPSQN